MSHDPETEPHPDSAIVLDASAAAPHPEEMRGTVRFRIGNWVSIDATARATPAGLITLGLLVTAIAAPLLIAGRRNRAR
ncbi:MAG TPA: hypothetical protein VGG77_09165 [Roseiarcus sp.]|jgi:hypothetical protein